MLRFLFRLLAAISLSISVIMAVLDATRTVASSQLVMTPLNTSWLTVSPQTFAAAQSYVTQHMHPLAWNPVIVTVLNQPGFAVFLAFALLFYMIGRRPGRRAEFAVEA